MVIHEPDLTESAKQMQHHLELMKGKAATPKETKILAVIEGEPQDALAQAPDEEDDDE